MEIENKIILITGGANGIGYAYADEFLRNGAAHTAILDLSNSNGERAADKLNEEFGMGRAIFIVCDVSKPRELEDAFEKTFKEFGRLDIVINNAGIMDDSKWELMIDVNFKAIVRGILLGFNYMSKEKGGKGGTIVNVSSTLGFMPMSTNPIYSGTKHAVIGTSRSFGEPSYYNKTGVRVMAMCPGATQTQLFAGISERTLRFLTEKEIETLLSQFNPQKIENVVKGMLHLIRVGESGSVWVANDGKPAFEIEWPDYLAEQVEVKDRL